MMSTSIHTIHESMWAHAARLFYAWNSRRQVWDYIGQYDDTYTPGVFGTTANVHTDIHEFLGITGLYDNSWVGEVGWVWVNPPNPQAGWYLHHMSDIDPPLKGLNR